MVQYRKPTRPSENLIDRRGENKRTKAPKGARGSRVVVTAKRGSSSRRTARGSLGGPYFSESAFRAVVDEVRREGPR